MSSVPYTVTLTTAPWIRRSRFKRVSSLYNRFKPLFGAYMGPYKDRYRYWTGILLLARVVLTVLFSSIANTNTVAGPQLNLLLLIFYTNRPLYNTQTIQDKAAEWTGAILPRTPAHFLHFQSLYFKHWCWR